LICPKKFRKELAMATWKCEKCGYQKEGRCKPRKCEKCAAADSFTKQG
jgi:rubrerythrin